SERIFLQMITKVTKADFSLDSVHSDLVACPPVSPSQIRSKDFYEKITHYLSYILCPLESHLWPGILRIRRADERRMGRFHRPSSSVDQHVRRHADLDLDHCHCSDLGVSSLNSYELASHLHSDHSVE